MNRKSEIRVGKIGCGSLRGLVPSWCRLGLGKNPRVGDIKLDGFLFALGVLALALSGCAYELGSANGLAAHGRSLQIRPFLNQTVEPRLTDAVTAELRRAVQQDGTFKL